MRTDRDPRELFVTRIGDDERERCLEELVEHHLQGRLTVDELERRQATALTARTESELVALVADLPWTTSHRSPATQPHQRSRLAAVDAVRWVVPPVGLLMAAVAAGDASFNDEFVVTTVVLSGIGGYLSHWIFPRRRRR